MAAAPSPSLRERVRLLALNQLQALLSYWRLYTAAPGADRDAFAQTALDYSKAYGVLDLPPLPPPVKEPSASLEDSHMRKRAAVEDRLRELALPQLRALLYTWQLCPNSLPLDRHAFLQVALGYAHLHKVVELPPLPPRPAEAAASLAGAEEEAAPRKRRLQEEEEEAGECAEREGERGSVVKRLRMASPAAPVPFSPAPFFRPRRTVLHKTEPSSSSSSVQAGLNAGFAFGYGRETESDCDVSRSPIPRVGVRERKVRFLIGGKVKVPGKGDSDDESGEEVEVERVRGRKRQRRGDEDNEEEYSMLGKAVGGKRAREGEEEDDIALLGKRGKYSNYVYDCRAKARKETMKKGGSLPRHSAARRRPSPTRSVETHIGQIQGSGGGPAETLMGKYFRFFRYVTGAFGI